MAVMKTTDKSSTLVGTSPTAAHGPTAEIRNETDAHRRRLIRGASALPVLLTLRSKGLAAQSCTGARYEEGRNVFRAGTPFERVGSDVALTDLQLCGPDGHQKISGGTPVSETSEANTKCRNAKVTPGTVNCGGKNNPYSGFFCCDVDVAIVSGAAWTSIATRGI